MTVTETTRAFAFAGRIKKPIPLAALAVLTVAVVALAIVRAGAAHVGAMGYTIVVVVAVVALLALVVALALAKPARVTITTGGDYSPGEASGDYSVSRSENRPNTRKPANPAPRDPSGSHGSRSIETKGSHSPGRVGGSFNVQEDPPA